MFKNLDFNKSKEKIWDEIHLKNIGYWLSNYSYDLITKYHKIEKYLTTRQNVMEIGIGTGSTIKELSKNHTTIAVDISPVALEKIKQYVYATYLTEDIIKIEIKINLAICNLVFQHCNIFECQRLIKDTLSVLAHDGIFSFQFANILNTPKNSIKQSIESSFMHYFYTPENMKKLVEKNNGKIINIIGPYTFMEDENKIDWYIFHITNN